MLSFASEHATNLTIERKILHNKVCAFDKWSLAPVIVSRAQLLSVIAIYIALKSLVFIVSEPGAIAC